MLVQDVTESPYGKSGRTLEVYPQVINELYERGEIAVEDLFQDNAIQIYPNQPLVLKAGQQSVLAITNRAGDTILRAKDDISYFKVKGRNKEQILMFNLLSDPDIRCVVVTGAAGTGKSLCLGAYALSQVMESTNDTKLLLSKPLETVGRGKFLGTVPGSMDDKFAPFLMSFTHMFEGLVGNNGASYISAMMERGIIKFVPLELMRGASFRNSVVWYDEAQSIDAYEMETLGSRIDDKGMSQLILSGDLNQRDRNIRKDHTGLSKLVHSRHFMKSPYTAHIHLTQNERGAISQLFYDVFHEDD